MIASSSSPLRKVVFIKRVALFTCSRPGHAVKLTKGINSEFEETMLNYTGFMEALVAMEKHRRAPSSPIGIFKYNYYCRKDASRQLIPLLLHETPLCRWLLVEILLDEDHNNMWEMDIKDHPSKFGLFLKAIFQGKHGDEIIEAIQQMREKGVLPKDLSTARLGASKSTLLHTALRHHFDHYKFDADEAMNEPTATASNSNSTNRDEVEMRKLLSYLIVTCGIHPFRTTDANGFTPFHVAIRHHGWRKLPLIRMMVELLPENERNNQQLLASLINKRIASHDPGSNHLVDNLRTPLGVLICSAPSTWYSPESTRAQYCLKLFLRALEFLKSVGADPTLEMVSQSNGFTRYSSSIRSEASRYSRVFKRLTPAEYCASLANKKISFREPRDMLLKWSEEVENEKKKMKIMNK